MGERRDNLIARHLEWCRLRNLRQATIVARRNTLRRVERTVGELEDATPEDLAGWWASLENGFDSRCTDLSHIRQFYKWLQREGLRADDPTVRIMRPRLRARLPRPIAEDDLMIALLGARDRVRPWLFLAAYCGLRAGEIARLRVDDLLELEDGPAILVADGKSSRERVVPMPARIRTELGLVPRSGFVFRRVDDPSEPNPPHLVSHLANDELRQLAIPATLHQLRHRYGTQLYRASRDLRLVQGLMGHASPTTTAGYTAYSTGTARVLVDAL